jgi:hypothetical protein
MNGPAFRGNLHFNYDESRGETRIYLSKVGKELPRGCDEE